MAISNKYEKSVLLELILIILFLFSAGGGRRDKKAEERIGSKGATNAIL